jgi:hypothetical protein
VDFYIKNNIIVACNAFIGFLYKKGINIIINGKSTIHSDNSADTILENK